MSFERWNRMNLKFKKSRLTQITANATKKRSKSRKCCQPSSGGGKFVENVIYNPKNPLESSLTRLSFALMSSFIHQISTEIQQQASDISISTFFIANIINRTTYREKREMEFLNNKQ